MAEPRGPQIVDEHAELHRRLPDRNSIDHDSRPTSIAFRLADADHGLLSVRDGRSQSARESVDFWRNRGDVTLGAAVVRVSALAALGLQAFEDGDALDPLHAVIDLRAWVLRSDGQRRRISKQIGERVHEICVPEPPAELLGKLAE
jgi:hypothetical protein